MKLSDLTETEVIAEFRRDTHWIPMEAFQRLCGRYPEKIVNLRFERMEIRGFIGSGVSTRSGWLEPESNWFNVPDVFRSDNPSGDEFEYIDRGLDG